MLDTSTDAAGAEGKVIARIGGSGLLVQLEASGHAAVSDEPITAGGTGKGPSPYDYVLEGLGACTAMTLRMFADRHGWPLEGVVVKLSHSRVHAEDCKDCETRTGYVNVIDRSIELLGVLDAAQRERLMQIADRCPVHRMLTAEIKIRTVEVGG